MGLSRFGLLVVAALTVSACTGGDPQASPSNPPPSTPPPTTLAAAAPAFKASALDLCHRTDIAPLADLSLKVDGTDNSPPAGDGSVCLWRMRSADGNLSTLRVEAIVLPSAGDAARAFQAQQNVSVMKADTQIGGLGDQAEGRT
ncbi:MAG TPA: hypothetical protein VF062_19325, partial [Candidatus Limnocylindrales bacterium]